MDITYKLPHPVRIKSTKEGDDAANEIDKVFDYLFEDLDVEACPAHYLVNVVSQKMPDYFRKLVEAEGTDHLARITLCSELIPYKFRKLEGNILTTSDEIDKKLEDADIGDDIPITYLKAPYNNCYIEFTESRKSSLRLFNQESGEHILEGVYVSEATIEPKSPQMEYFSSDPREKIDSSQSLRVLDLMFTGSPVGKSGYLDDTLRIQGFFIKSESLTIKEELVDIVKIYGEDEDFVGDINYLSEALMHISKVLLFSNCKQYRDTVFDERKELQKKVTSLKSPAKIKKYTNKLRKTYDRRIIQPLDNVVYSKDKDEEHSNGHKPKAPHWRKGHFRMQPYGPGSTKRKVQFIEPTVVGGLFADKKPYLVKEKAKSKS